MQRRSHFKRRGCCEHIPRARGRIINTRKQKDEHFDNDHSRSLNDVNEPDTLSWYNVKVIITNIAIKNNILFILPLIINSDIRSHGVLPIVVDVALFSVSISSSSRVVCVSLFQLVND